jgi:hypothetical protein
MTTTITNWNEIFSQKTFWIQYLRLFLIDDKNNYFKETKLQFENTTIEINQIYENYDSHQNDEANTITIYFSSNYHIEITFGQEGEYFSLHHPSFSEPNDLGWDDGSFRLPIFRQEELKTLNQKAFANFDSKYIPLLFFKTAWVFLQNDDEESCKINFTIALQQISVFSDQEIQLILSHLFWINETLQWRFSEDFGWTIAPINPENKVNGYFSLRKTDTKTALALKAFFEKI